MFTDIGSRRSCRAEKTEFRFTATSSNVFELHRIKYYYKESAVPFWGGKRSDFLAHLL